MPEVDNTIQRLQDQTAQNTQDIASLITSVTSLAHTVERHERMMVDGFNKMEQALDRGLSSVTNQINTERARTEDNKIPWWQLVAVLTTVITVFGGGLAAFVLLLTGSIEKDVADMQAVEQGLQAQVIENRVESAVNSAIRDHLIRDIEQNREAVQALETQP